MITTQCSTCNAPFSYEPLGTRPRRICDPCKSVKVATFGSRTVPCEECKTPFTYCYNGRPRLFCDGCRRAKRRASSQAQLRNLKEAATTLGHTSDAFCEHIDRLAVRTHAEVAELLGITPQTCRQLERSALAKLRKAFAFELRLGCHSSQLFEDTETVNQSLPTYAIGTH